MFGLFKGTSSAAFVQYQEADTGDWLILNVVGDKICGLYEIWEILRQIIYGCDSFTKLDISDILYKVC
jgi:hypothetical protein